MGFIAFGWLSKKFAQGGAAPKIERTFFGSFGTLSGQGPQDVIAAIGSNQSARMSLGTVIMTPTVGMRLISVLSSALILFLLWGPARSSMSMGLWADLFVCGMFIYMTLYIAGYEAKYDAEGLTAPNWFFQNRHYTWENLISIKDAGGHIYQLRFEGGKVSLQKHLVGIATFLTFVSDIQEMRKRA